MYRFHVLHQIPKRKAKKVYKNIGKDVLLIKI